MLADMQRARSGHLQGIQFVNIKTSEKYDVLGGYYFVDGERFIGFMRLLPGNTQPLQLGDYLCCVKTGCAFQVIEQPDAFTYIIGGLCREEGRATGRSAA